MGTAVRGCSMTFTRTLESSTKISRCLEVLTLAFLLGGFQEGDAYLSYVDDLQMSDNLYK